MTTKDPVALIGEVHASIQTMKENNEKVTAALQEASEKSGSDAKAAISKAEAAAKEVANLSASLLEIEQKLADGVKAGKTDPKTLGEFVVKSDAFKQFALGNVGKFRIEANTITGQEGSPAENADTLVQPMRLAGIVDGAYRSLRVRDVLPSGVTSSNAVEYSKEATFTNNAAETAEGAQKPESALTYTLATANVRTIAHTIKVSKQVLDDAPALQSHIDTRMRYGIEYRYDNQLLNGNGSGQNISGITASGNYTAFTPVTGDNALDSINRAIELVALADYSATAIMLNTADWHAIERLKVGASDDRYIVGDPMGMIGPRLWGLPVVVSNAVASGKLLVGAFNISHQVFNRQGAAVEMFNQNEDDVEKNLLTIRAELRGTLATYRAASVYYGDLTL